MNAVRGKTDSVSKIFINVGIDSCILGMGVTSGIVLSAEASAKIGQGATAVALFFVAIDLFVTAICTTMRDIERITEAARARVSFFCGLFILIFNTGIVVAIKTL
jgi:hypothetical protein